MNFLLTLHRSIVDPPFYRDVLTLPKKKVAGYFIKLLLFTGLLTGMAQTFYLVHPQRGISRWLDSAFHGMEIKNGTLSTDRKEPYYPPSYVMTPILDQLFGVPNIFNENSDSIVIVDATDKLK